VSGTKMFRKTKEFARDFETPTFSEFESPLWVMSRQNEMSRPFRDRSHAPQSLERELRLVLSSKPRPSAPVSGRRIRMSKFAVQRLDATSLETGSMMQNHVPGTEGHSYF
jgi:hypothetical protein